MIVIINGMPRSGSTLAFNVTRRLVQISGRLNESFPAAMTQSGLHRFLLNARSDPLDHSIAVVKCHYFIPPFDCAMHRHVKIIYTYRNPLDAMYSSIKIPEKAKVFEKMGYEPFIGGLELDYSHWLSMIWMPMTIKTMLRYEDFAGRVATNMVEPIAGFLGLYIDSMTYQSIANEFAVERVRNMTQDQHVADSVTQFRPGHVSKGLGKVGRGAEHLPPVIAARIRLQFEMWMKECFWT